MKLGVFGGTFDPVHMGHLIIAEEACSRLGLDELLFIAAGRPWFKRDEEVTEAVHRLNMLELAVDTNPNFRVSDMEVRRAGPSYTVDTLEELSTGRTDDPTLYVVVGTDALREIDRWRSPGRVLEMANVVGIARPGDAELDIEALDAIHEGASKRAIILRGPEIGISSTDIRRRVVEGMSIRYLVPEPVESYIYEQGLYRGGQRG